MIHLFYHQFHDKIDQILESLDRVVERLRQPPSISAEVEKIKEQISENKNVSVDMEKLQPLYETLKQRGEEMIARSGGTDKDISAKGNHFRIRKQLIFTFKTILNVHTVYWQSSCISRCQILEKVLQIWRVWGGKTVYVNLLWMSSCVCEISQLNTKCAVIQKPCILWTF